MDNLLVSLVQLGFGAVLCLGGYRLFVAVLPIFAFFFGFLGGGSAIAAFLGEGFLRSLAGWLTGMALGVALAIFAFFLFDVAVALLAGAAGFVVGTAVLAALGIGPNGLTFVLSAALGVAAVVGAYVLKVSKPIVIVATALIGANMIVAGTLLLLGRVTLDRPDAGTVAAAIRDHPIWLVVWAGVMVAGLVVQWRTTVDFEVELPHSQFST